MMSDRCNVHIGLLIVYLGFLIDFSCGVTFPHAPKPDVGQARMTVNRLAFVALDRLVIGVFAGSPLADLSPEPS
jgi:hypothetical protein